MGERSAPVIEELDVLIVGAGISGIDGAWHLQARCPGKSYAILEARERVGGTWDLFLYPGSGYYDYDRGYRPEWAGEEDFKGRFVHPQFWPEDLDYAGQRIVVIGSGATAVTLIPSLAETAAHVTMLQRSPSYIVARPS